MKKVFRKIYRFFKNIFVFVVQIITIILVILGIYIVILCNPEFLFDNRTVYKNFTLYSDQSIPEEAQKILKGVEDKALKTGIYSPAQKFNIFICNNENRFIFLTNYHYKAGGMTYAVLNGNIFIRRSDIEENLIFDFYGLRVNGERTLEYCISHEVIHDITVNNVGKIKFLRMPVWIREGVADYYSLPKFNFPIEMKKFKENSYDMDPGKSGFYNRYRLLTAYYIEKKKLKLQELLLLNKKQEEIEGEFLTEWMKKK